MNNEFKEEFRLKVHKFDRETLVAICDKNLVSKKLKNYGVPINVTEHFYGESLYTEKEILTRVKTASQLNVIGNNIVNLLTKNGVIPESAILWLKDKNNEKVGHSIIVI